MASICNGGGGASAIIVENLNWHILINKCKNNEQILK